MNDLFRVRFAVLARGEFIQKRADSLHNLDILLFIVSADIVSFARNALRDNEIERAGMVFHIEPVAHLQTFAVNGEFLAVERMENDQRNEFFGEMVRSIVV